MTTITVKLSDEDAALVRKYANFAGVTISDFARTAILEKVEDSCDLQELRETLAKDNGERFSIDEALGDL